jgi:hypothetical protein
MNNYLEWRRTVKADCQIADCRRQILRLSGAAACDGSTRDCRFILPRFSPFPSQKKKENNTLY